MIDPVQCKTVVDWAAAGAWAGALGTFSAALVALHIWRRDLKAATTERTEQAASLALLIASEVQRLCAPVHEIASHFSCAEPLRSQRIHAYANSPSLLFENLSLISTVPSERLERLSEILGILPPAATTQLATLIVSISQAEGMRAATAEKSTLTIQEVEKIASAMLTLRDDAHATYLVLAKVAGRTDQQLSEIRDMLNTIATND